MRAYTVCGNNEYERKRGTVQHEDTHRTNLIKQATHDRQWYREECKQFLDACVPPYLQELSGM